MSLFDESKIRPEPAFQEQRLSDPIFVTRPFLPPLEEFLPMLEEIWRSRTLTNAGPFHGRLEEELVRFLDVSRVSLVTNGALALSIALKAAELEGEVITTPYSFVATAHSIKMEGLDPVFVDIRPDTLNIDPEQIEAAITPRTSAILAVHVYGTPCDVEQIEQIARRRGLKVIYDAAHAFGVRLGNRNVLSWGDFSILSFHATKSFNTFEGGAIISSDAESQAAVHRLRNFGILNELEIPEIGTNAKMSEFNAALGVLQLKYFEWVRKARGEVDARYREGLADLPGIDLVRAPESVQPNYSYFPILVGPEFPLTRDGLYDRLAAAGFHARRYFYPLLSNLPAYRGVESAARQRLPIANRISDQILCLPIFPELAPGVQDLIMEAIKTAT